MYIQFFPTRNDSFIHLRNAPLNLFSLTWDFRVTFISSSIIFVGDFELTELDRMKGFHCNLGSNFLNY